jgi:hypothetical protein
MCCQARNAKAPSIVTGLLKMFEGESLMRSTAVCSARVAPWRLSGNQRSSALRVRDDEEASTAISDVISSCAGVLAASARVRKSSIWISQGSCSPSLPPAWEQTLRSCSTCFALLGTKVLEHDIDGLSIRIREGLLGDGVGTRVWAVATTLCRCGCQPRLAMPRIQGGCGASSSPAISRVMTALVCANSPH